MTILKIAFRNLNRQKRRSMLLLLGIAFSFLVVTLVDGLAAGAMKGLEHQFANIFGGHVYIMGAEKSADRSAKDYAKTFLRSTDLIEKSLSEIGVKPKYITMRAVIEGLFIFGGNKAGGNVFGCVFDEEQFLQDSISFIEGSWESMKKENAILMSETLVKKLKLELHDTVLMETTTYNGQATVVEFQLEGISKDAGQLSQISSYVNLSYANKIQGADDGVFASYGIFLSDITQQNYVATLLEKKLGEYAPITSRDLARKLSPQSPITNLQKQLNEGVWEGTKYSVASMNDFAPQMATIVVIVNNVSLGILLVLLAITMIGVSNTFRMVVHERKSEVGTMRSCGVTRTKVRWLFIMEALLLAIIGAVIGIILAIVIMKIVGLFPIASDSVLSIFATDGYFKGILSPMSIILKVLLMLILTILAARGAAKRAANMIPAEALRVGK